MAENEPIELDGLAELSREELAALLASFPSPTDGEDHVPGALSPPSYYKHRRARSEQPVDEMGVMLAAG